MASAAASDECLFMLMGELIEHGKLPTSS